jgi:hypothetical protein
MLSIILNLYQVNIISCLYIYIYIYYILLEAVGFQQPILILKIRREGKKRNSKFDYKKDYIYIYNTVYNIYIYIYIFIYKYCIYPFPFVISTLFSLNSFHSFLLGRNVIMINNNNNNNNNK